MRRVAFAIVLAIAAVGVWIGTRDAGRVAPATSSAEPASANPTASVAGDMDSPKRKTAPPGAPATATSASDFEPLDPKAFKGEQRRELQLVAQTPEEALWLDARGYPRASEWAGRADIPLADLEAGAASGDTLAMVMLAERLFGDAEPGARYWGAPGRERAIRLLEQAFEDGNVFAQVVMAQTMAKYLEQTTKVGPDGRPEWGRRYDSVLLNIEILALLGDYRAGDLLMSLDIPRSPGFSSAGMSSAVIVAFSTLAGVNERRARRGLQPLVPVPRPGAATALDASLERRPIQWWRGWR
jgi:hypothetical protein